MKIYVVNLVWNARFGIWNELNAKVNLIFKLSVRISFRLDRINV